MAEFGGALDSWLEAPYVNAARQEAAFEAWCEREGVEFDADDAWERFEQALADDEPDCEPRWDDDPPDGWEPQR